jgi:hypothetical protein
MIGRGRRVWALCRFLGAGYWARLWGELLGLYKALSGWRAEATRSCCEQSRGVALENYSPCHQILGPKMGIKITGSLLEGLISLEKFCSMLRCGKMDWVVPVISITFSFIVLIHPVSLFINFTKIY